MAKSADAFRTISEVADWLGVQTHVLRFWESKFTQVKPVKRAGGRRYYRPADMLLLGGIRKLLHDDGLTIKGVQKILREKGMAHVTALSPAVDGVDTEQPEIVGKKTQQDDPAASIEHASLEAVEPATAEVVPFLQDPKKPEADAPAPERPSFTQDAVTEPDSASEPVAETLADTGSAKKADAPNEAPELPKEPSADAPFDAAQDAPAAQSEATVTSEAPETPKSETPVSETQEMDPITADMLGTDSDEDEPTKAAGIITDGNLPEDNSEPELQLETPADGAAMADSTPVDPRSDGVPADEDEDPIPVLPSFLSRVTKVPPSVDSPPRAVIKAEPAPDDSSSEAAQAPTPEPEIPEPASPKPNNIDLPDLPNEAEIAASPRALGALAARGALTPSQAAKIAPLLAQLRNVRDRMAQTRKE
jgi:DNA-binding transcriptional MerR regulator